MKKNKKESLHIPPSLASELRAYSRLIDILSKLKDDNQRQKILRCAMILLDIPDFDV